jgi:hypothetical protein
MNFVQEPMGVGTLDDSASGLRDIKAGAKDSFHCPAHETVSLLA